MVINYIFILPAQGRFLTEWLHDTLILFFHIYFKLYSTKVMPTYTCTKNEKSIHLSARLQKQDFVPYSHFSHSLGCKMIAHSYSIILPHFQYLSSPLYICVLGIFSFQTFIFFSLTSKNSLCDADIFLSLVRNLTNVFFLDSPCLLNLFMIYFAIQSLIFMQSESSIFYSFLFS